MITGNLSSFSRRRLFPLLLLTILSLVSAYGQNGYRMGKIIVNDSTVLEGYILQVNNEGAITQCHFRRSSRSLPRVFLPGDIETFYFNDGRRFIPGKNVSPELAGLFLEVLFDGAADLLYYSGPDSEHYLISGINGRVFKLNLNTRSKSFSDVKASEEYESIRSMLRIIMADVPGLSDRIAALVPGRESLTSLMHDYHLHLKGTAADIIYESPPPAVELHAGLYAGFTADIFNVAEGGDLESFSLDPALCPRIGLVVTSPLPRLTRNLSVTLDISLARSYSYGFSRIGQPDSDDILFRELHMHRVITDNSLLAGYTAGKGRLHLSFSAGPSLRILLADDSRIEADTSGDGLVVSDSYPYLADRTFMAGVKIATGLTWDMSPGISLFLNAGYTRFSGDEAISGINSFNVVTGILF